MQRDWFNKTFSSVGTAIRLIREADTAGDYEIVCSSTNPHAPAYLAAHASSVEPSGLTGPAYLAWCLDFCRTQGIGIFIPGKEASLIGGAQAGDVVLVAGKGHESVQIVGLEHRPFSDQAEVRAALGVAAPGGAA